MSIFALIHGHHTPAAVIRSALHVRIPEQRRVFITILDEVQGIDSDKQTAWNDFKRMVKDTAHENDLLTEDAFSRSGSGRELIHFTDGVDGVEIL